MKTLLKNHKYIMVLFAALVVGSCSKDDDPPAPTAAELLINKWVVVKVEDLSTSPPTVTEAGSCGGKWYYIFTSDGTFFSESFYVDPNTDSCVSSGIQTGTYELTLGEEKIVLIEENPPNSYTVNIVSLSSAELVISAPEAPEYNYHFKPETDL